MIESRPSLRGNASSMRPLFSFVFLASAIFSILQFSPAWADSGNTVAQAADLVLTNASIYTVDASRSWADCLAIRNGDIAYVGAHDGLSKFIGPETKVFDLQGKLVLPGLHDCHVHPLDGGKALSECQLDDAKNLSELVERVKKFAASHPQTTWIVGAGWALPMFDQAGPRKEALDQVVADRPVYLEAADGHSAWVNSKALELAAISKETADPKLGHIEKDPATGQPTGTLRELAMALVSHLVPPLSPEQRVEYLETAIKKANSFGITSIQDAHVDADILSAYNELQNQGRLTLRTVAAIYVDPLKTEEQISELQNLRATYSNGMLRATSAKIFADGVIESHTAALLEPYADRPNDSGVLNFSPEQMRTIVAALDKSGMQVHVHAIGDRAIRNALDAFQRAREVNGTNDNRHQIAHLELIDWHDIVRFRELGVAANFQAFWAYSDQYITKCTVPVLGYNRTNQLYRIASMFKSGALVAAGSDWPVSTLNPLDAMEIAVTRRALGNTKEPSWIPDERAALKDMIAAYTIAGAYVNHEEKETGSLEAGKSADLIVLDKNLFKLSSDQIHAAKVLWTFLQGKAVYKQAGFDPVDIGGSPNVTPTPP
jgi:predicted amidohydrolase YtcJ